MILALAMALAMTPAPAGALGDPGGEVLVAFHGPVDGALIALHGGTVLREYRDLGIAHVQTSSVSSFASSMLLSLSVAFVESDDGLRLAGASPDAASWDAASWDAASWDAASWDAASWDAASWDAASWDAASWDAASWDAASWDAASWDGGAMDPGYTSQWGLGAANFPDAWTRTTGSGSVRVCVLDTGVDAKHPDLRPNLWRAADGTYGYNAMRGGSKSAADDHGHGTHVAGILGAVGGNGSGVTGAARVQLMAVKVMDASGGDESDLVQGLLFCAKNGARIATMSLHIDAPSPAVERAIQFAQARGVLVVASAGNAGASTVSYPAAYAGVLAVGALTPSGAVAGFSNQGAALDLVAPGYRIASTMTGGGYAIGSGTSQAAPFVAAAAALAWDAAPHLGAADVSRILTSTARDFGSAGHDPAYGHGALDAGAAVEAAAAVAVS